MSTCKVEIKTKPIAKQLRKELKQLEKMEVCCGFQQGKTTEEDGTDICDIAAWNEFGTVYIPARPFMRDGIDQHVDDIASHLEKQGAALMSGKSSAEQLLKMMGLKMKDVIQASITEGNWTPNAPSTIAKKHSSQPLVDTGRMRQSVNYIIREKGAGNS